MTSKVIKAFRDKKTGGIYEIGDEYSADTKRINELAKNGFVEKEQSPTVKDDA